MRHDGSAGHVVALLAVLALVSAAAVRAMVAVAVLDRPGARSSHTRPTPKGGGVGVVLAWLLGAALLPALGLAPGAPWAPALVAGAVAIAAISFLDDLRDWPFAVKLATQIAATLLVMSFGLSLTRLAVPGIGAVRLFWAGPAFTVLWIVAATNAVNFMDGLNGLAAGASALAALLLGLLAAGAGSPYVALAAFALAGGLAGFLPFNYPHARIFMGDVGSQFCGFVLACLAVAAGRYERGTLSFLPVPMLLFGLLFDVAFTLLRRLLAGQRLTEAHRGHLYQVVQRSGVPAWAVTLVAWGFVAWGGGCVALFETLPATWKPGALLLLLPPQLAWLGFAVRRARAARLGGW